MKPASILVTAFTFLCLLSAAAADFTEVPDSASPDGGYAARTEPPANVEDGRDGLVLYRKMTGAAVARIPLGGYAGHPGDADPANLRLLWAPDSKHFALMFRGTKTSWTTTVYAMNAGKPVEVKLAGATSKSLELLSASQTNRVSRETPVKWIDNGRLLLRASGDTLVGDKLMWYEIDMTCSLEGGKMTDAKVVTLKPHDG
ncbi:hypothetical protein JIN84_08435 [Luteolibacter yonseiensis]|uniref:Uncharacterized protein n=1 Tax=Luteolibacter yonseiensis TaxID=1144680 RepID=A0A934R545_9BACT|nr:hypothetical protein [Luteolibacter yonseiensis]MBK1815640.1 hypothetical protein [Luteolibacter yonseiensis]